MKIQLRHVKECRCGVVIGFVKAPHRTVCVDADSVYLYEGGGQQIGYTPDGQMKRGAIVSTPGNCGAWEVFREHRCPLTSGDAHG